MTAVGLNTWIWENQAKTTFLSILFPIILFGTIYIILFSFFYFDLESSPIEGMNATLMANEFFILILQIGIPIIIIWFFLSIYFHRQIIFKMSGAKELTRKENPTTYNIVENLCISRGLTVPKIGIMDQTGMNAFATGWSTKDSWIVFSKGLIQNLNKKEIEAVAAHELTHIINKDVRLMTIIVVFIGILGTLGYLLFRVSFFSGDRSRKDGKTTSILMFLGLGLYILSILIFPLIRLAISRKREFLADAGAVELTKDNHAMISALEKISKNSVIPKMQDRNLRAMCIESPQKKHIKSWFSSHPSIEERIHALKHM